MLNHDWRLMKRWTKQAVVVLGVMVCVALSHAGDKIEIVEKIDAGPRNDHYVSNREPLAPSPLVKLPIGSIKPQGWLRKQLELQADGFFGNLPELCRFLIKEGNPWLSPDGVGEKFWEEVPYWLRGYGDLAYVLDDEKMIKEAKVWIEGAIGSQREDGWFGPRANIASPRRHSPGKPDLWPNMPMLNSLQSYYEFSGDERVIKVMTRYFEWQMNCPEEDFLLPFWQQQRGGDNLASVYWLYNRTGDKKLLELAEKIHRKTANWTDGVPNWHNVNIAQALRGTPTYYQKSKDPKHLAAPENNYQTIWGEYGQVPGGLFGGDEDSRIGFISARQAVETCGMVEMMHSCEVILKISGDLKWADRCEDVAFNSFPASVTPDFRALRYLTSPNLVVSDSSNKNPRISNKGPKFQFNPHAHRCCQLNMGQGWPFFAEHIWMATPDNGVALVFYSESEVTAKVGKGEEVTITETTRYPFDENVELRLSMAKKQTFPLYLRIPKWCDRAELIINGKDVKVEATPQAFLRVEREWNDGDIVKLKLPMVLSVRTWEKNDNSVSVDRGPLTFSLKIDEKYQLIEGNPIMEIPASWRRDLTDEQIKAWPAFDVFPGSPWNYGLVMDKSNLEESFEVTMNNWPKDNNVWGSKKPPIEIKAKGKKIPEWKLDDANMAGLMSQSPVKSKERVEDITLIPMGAARLRLSAFPVIGDGADAKEWITPPEPPIIRHGRRKPPAKKKQKK